MKMYSPIQVDDFVCVNIKRSVLDDLYLVLNDMRDVSPFHHKVTAPMPGTSGLSVPVTILVHMPVHASTDLAPCRVADFIVCMAHNAGDPFSQFQRDSSMLCNNGATHMSVLQTRQGNALQRPSKACHANQAHIQQDPWKLA